MKVNESLPWNEGIMEVSARFRGSFYQLPPNQVEYTSLHDRKSINDGGRVFTSMEEVYLLPISSIEVISLTSVEVLFTSMGVLFTTMEENAGNCFFHGSFHALNCTSFHRNVHVSSKLYKET